MKLHILNFTKFLPSTKVNSTVATDVITIYLYVFIIKSQHSGLLPANKVSNLRPQVYGRTT
jgi:hypothetical protein